jgi:DNA-binding LytR/AlgR family response regulator
MSAANASILAGSQPLAGRRVLVMEDEYFIAEEVTRELVALGAEILGPFAAIEEAESLLRSGAKIDAALLDINIRNEMVFPLARSLRSRNVPLVFTSGYDRTSLGTEFHDAVLWEKPLDAPKVAFSIAVMIHRS